MTTNVKNSVDNVERVFMGLVTGAGFVINPIYTTPGITHFQKKMALRGF